MPRVNLRDDSGTASVAILFGIIATILTTSAIGLISATQNEALTETNYSGIQAAVDSKANLYQQDGNPGETCYPADNTCVTVTGADVATDGQSVTLKLVPVYGGITEPAEERVIPNGALITGFDASGNPVWN